MPEKIDLKLNRAMKDSLKAYASGHKRFFDYLQKDIRVYGPNSTEPIVGRKKFETAFGSEFKTKRKIDVIHSDVQMRGDQAILAQTLQITVKGVSSQLRQTVIWAKDSEGNWKMNHIHNTLVGQPIVTGALPKTTKDVRVLNERIATVAATVGVAQ